jgi:DNA-binding GntR family transcriptional regulator
VEIYKDSIQSQIYCNIRKEILDQNFKFGDQINPRKIAQANKISVTPVRDALLQLTTEGLVVNKERVGFFVRDFSIKDVIEIMEVRKMYEIYNLYDYFENIDRDELTRIYDNIKSDDIDKNDFYINDVSFHNLLVLSSNNRFLISEYERVKNLFALFIYYDTDYDHEAKKEHCEIIEYILNNKKDEAVEALKAHLDRVTKVIISSDHFKNIGQASSL